MKPSHFLSSQDTFCPYWQGETAQGEMCGVWNKNAAKLALSSCMMRYTGLSFEQQCKRIYSTPAFQTWAEENRKQDYRSPVDVYGFEESAHWGHIVETLRQANL